MTKITVGMPTFNRANYLKEAIKQVLEQSFTDFEFIIYNDGSVDNTLAVINSFKDPRIKIINAKNKGMPHPLNHILRIAKGEYIIILHDHDFFDKYLLEKSYGALEKYPDAGFVLQGSAWIDNDGISNYRPNLLNLPEYVSGKEFLKKYLLDENDFSSPIHACCMVRYSAYENVGKFYDEKFGWYSDNDLWLRLLGSYDFIYLKEVLFKFRGRELNHTLNDKAWDINKWIYDIHKINIQRNFANDTLLFNKAMLLLNKKINKSSKKIFFQSLVKGDKDFLLLSIKEIKKYNKDFFIRLILFLLKRIKFLQDIVLILGPRLNRARKIFLGLKCEKK